jgi:hypothetical protein
LRLTTTSASAPPLISRPTTGRVMGDIYLSFLSPLERAHTRPFTGKERSKTTASQLPARHQLYPFLRVFSPTSQRIFLLLLSARLVAIIIPREYYLHRALCARASVLRRPAVCRFFARPPPRARRRDADETTRRGPAMHLSLSFFLARTRPPNEPAT